MADILNLKKRAETYFAEGKLELAKECYLEAIAFSPNQAQTYHKLGEILSLQENWQEAVDAYCQTININPNFALAYHKLGEALTQLGCHQEAVEAYKSAIKLKPEFPWSYHKLGEILMKLENWEEAVLTYRRLIEVQPELIWAYNKLGDACEAKELLDEAVFCYNRVLEKTPNSAAVLKKMGLLLQKLGRPQEAISCYQKLIKLRPNNWELYSMLGQCLVKVGDFDGAIATFKLTLKLNPNLPWCHYHLGETLAKLQQWDEAVVAYKAAFDLERNNNLFVEKVGTAQKKLNRVDETIVFYQKAIEFNPHEWRYYKYLGEIYIQKENWEDALACLIQLLQIKPDYHPTYRNIADILEKQGKLKAAQSWNNSFKLPQDVLEKHCQLTGNFKVKSKLETGIFYQTIYPESTVKLRPSQTIGKKASSDFKRKDIKLQEAFVAVFPEGRAWADRHNSVAITSDNKLVEELYTGCGEIVLSSKRLPPFQYIDGTVAFLSVKEGHGYYHWMFDLISRFDLLERSGLKLSEIDYFVANRCQNNFQTATLKKLGIPLEKVLENCDLHLKAKRLVVPSLNRGCRASYWACNFLRSRFLTDVPETKKGPERIYISRKLASRRRVINEEEVVNFLEKLGFVSVILESMLLEEQARCFAAAKVVIGPHGAGLTNLVFCNPGTKAIEIFSPEYVPECYWQLSNASGLGYYYLIGEEFNDDSLPFPGCRNILVNLKQLSKLMKKAGVA